MALNSASASKAIYLSGFWFMFYSVRAVMRASSSRLLLLRQNLSFSIFDPFPLRLPIPIPRRRDAALHSQLRVLANQQTKPKGSKRMAAASAEHLKKRTRSGIELDRDLYKRYASPAAGGHVPVMLGEVLDAFRPPHLLRSFVDCTLGAGGHSAAVRPQSHLSLFLSDSLC